MSDGTSTFVYQDPAVFDGDPSEVAKRATEQAARACQLAQGAVVDANTQARNAWMTRNLEAGQEADAAGWEESEEGKAWSIVLRVLGQLPGRIAGLGVTAAGA